MLHILHTESSCGFGGQEMRILKEAKQMRARGYTISIAAEAHAEILPKAKELGLYTHAIPFKKHPIQSFFSLLKIIHSSKVDIVNTHSSKDAWVGGAAAKFRGVPVIRTRHLSTPFRGGLNAYIIYGKLADFVTTTSKQAAIMIEKKGRVPKDKILCLATGIIEEEEEIVPDENFLEKNTPFSKEDFIVGTLCVLRSWKGVQDLLDAAAQIQERNIKFLIIGDGPSKDFLHAYAKERCLQDKIFFTGFMDMPQQALHSLNIFALLSTGNEGISQASLKAAYAKKPLITTNVGGLPDVCLPGQTGFIVPPKRPDLVAKYIRKLYATPHLQEEFGNAAHELVKEKFLFEGTLDQLEEIYSSLCKP